MAEHTFRQRYGRYFWAIALIVLALFLLRPIISSLPAAPDETAAPVETATATSTPLVVNTAEPSPYFDYDAVDTSLQTFDLSNLPVRRDDSLRPAMNPSTFRGKLPQHEEFQRYTVLSGDTPIGIADRFGIIPETLLGGNPQLSEEAGLLFADSELIILPIDGVLHDVQYGDTLENLAAKYNVAVDDIIAYQPNNLEFPYRLYEDTQILVPGAVREVFKWDPPDVSAAQGNYQNTSNQLVVGYGSFIWPTTGYRITQTYWYGHQAVDVGIETGTPLYAADSGKVTFAAWSPYCYANLIVINHRNGFETFYAHLSSFNVVPGQVVFQGNLIGYSGNTGCSTGPHLHFEIRRNGTRLDPCAWTNGC